MRSEKARLPSPNLTSQNINAKKVRVHRSPDPRIETSRTGHHIQSQHIQAADCSGGRIDPRFKGGGVRARSTTNE